MDLEDVMRDVDVMQDVMVDVSMAGDMPVYSSLTADCGTQNAIMLKQGFALREAPWTVGGVVHEAPAPSRSRTALRARRCAPGPGVS